MRRGDAEQSGKHNERNNIKIFVAAKQVLFSMCDE